MATEYPVLIVSREAGADLSAKQFCFVKLNATGKIVACNGLTDVPFGVLQNKPKSGATAEVLRLGLSKVSCNAAIAIGDLIGTSADGQAATKAVGTNVTHYVVGMADDEAATAADDIITASINCMNPHRAT